MRPLLPSLVFLCACSAAAVPGEESPDPEDGTFLDLKADGGCLQEGSAVADGVLELVNDPAVDLETLDASTRDGGVGLYRRAAEGIVDARPIADLAALDDVPWVGRASCAALARYACNVADRCVGELKAMTWNIEHFPMTAETEDAVVEVFEQVRPDVVGVQEIEDVDAFERMMERLPEYDAILAEPGFLTRVGIIVRRDAVEVQSTDDLFVGDRHAFPRPVVAARLQPVGSDDTFEFAVVHLKAMGDDASQARRRAAVARLRVWLDAQREAGAGEALIVGDWNDELTDAAEDNVFEGLADDGGVQFLTLEPEEAGAVSYVPWRRMLDHVMASDELLADLPHENTEVLELDVTWRADFVDAVSDHRPVVSRFLRHVRYPS